MTNNIYKNLFKEDSSENEISFLLKEGINIDRLKKIVTFDPNKEENINTSIQDNPAYSKFNGYDVVSIFQRLKNENRDDGTPLLLALKNKNNWKISEEDKLSILNNFVEISKKIKEKYDTIIMIPSASSLNNDFLYKLNEVIQADNVFTSYFEKLEPMEVWNEISDSVEVQSLDGNNQKKLYSYLEDMAKFNNNKFTFSLIKDTKLRKYVQVMFKKSSLFNELQYQTAINNKDVLLLDDTITSGTTVSSFCKNFIETYVPKSVTVVTLFSPLK